MPHILTLTGLFPSSARPRHGIFVEERLRHLVAEGEITASVLAPVPWFPFASSRFGEYAEFARTPSTELRHGIEVRYPRYLVIPKLGMNVAPFLLALALLPVVRRLQGQHKDLALIDSHFLYPDGVAACLVGRWLGIPVLMTARGSDVNLYPQYAVPRALIRWAVRHSARVVTVSEALRRGLLALGADPAKVITLRNGVDLQRFNPGDTGDREAARLRLGLTGPTVLSVGNLLELKGHHLLVEALVQLPGVTALIAGEGPMRPSLERLASERGVGDRVRLLGNLPQEELVACYRAADMLVLASSREGMPNVVLESLACGTPVIATPVGGIPELIDSAESGLLLADRSAGAIVQAVRALRASPPDRARVAAQGARFSWKPTIDGLTKLVRQLS
ncbi:MAG: glycosyltransferase family 4 protein [Gammaproteobacteria bacterium]